MSWPSYVCPRCRGALRTEQEGFRCPACVAHYPVVAGIPDFRIFPDPWIGLEEDRAKALRVEAAIAGLDFEASVRRYWEMTPETPVALSERYVAHVTGAAARSRQWLAGLPPAAPGRWLELGCGTGDLLAAAPSEVSIVGTDIALRWLVVARKRPLPRDGRLPLVCCCAEALPFAAGQFARVVGLGLLEHCADPIPVCRESRRVLRPGGDLAVRTVNRFSLLPEPHVDVWGVGFLPRGLADRYVRWRTGRGYRHHRPLSGRELRGAMVAAGFRQVRVGAARALEAEQARLGRWTRRAVPWYDASRRLPVARGALALVAPLLEASGVAP